MNFCVSLLTCNNRNTTEKTIGAFIENTKFNNLDFFVYAQGCTPEYIENLQKIKHPEINFKYIIKEKNIGLTPALNELNSMVKEYKYVLFLEDDWICITKNKGWLKDSLQLLESNKDISTVFLRKYFDDKEKWHYGWTRTIPYHCHKHKDNFNYEKKMAGSNVVKVGVSEFQHIPTFLFTNNPCIRRNDDYYRVGAYPFPHYDDIKNNRDQWIGPKTSNAPNWGWAEAVTMEKIRDLTAYYIKDGIFGHHEDFF